MTKTRRLADLFIVGKEVVFDDGTLDDDLNPVPPLVVWLQKINPMDHERAVRSSNARRSTVLALLKDKESTERKAAIGEVYLMSKDELIAEVTASDLLDRRYVIEAEVGADEEWDDHNYLQGLQDAWTGGLDAAYAIDPEDPEAKQVYDELARFSAQCEATIEHDRGEMFEHYNRYSEIELRDKWMEKRLKLEADQEWLREFHRCEIYYATRDIDNHRKYYFKDRDEMEACSTEVLFSLLAEYSTLTIEPVEGKDLRLTQTSSTPSGSAEKQETDESSGPVELTV